MPSLHNELGKRDMVLLPGASWQNSARETWQTYMCSRCGTATKAWLQELQAARAPVAPAPVSCPVRPTGFCVEKGVGWRHFAFRPQLWLAGGKRRTSNVPCISACMHGCRQGKLAAPHMLLRQRHALQPRAAMQSMQLA